MNIRISLPLVLAACAAVGFVGYFTGLRTQSVSEDLQDYKTRYEQLQAKMQNFTDADFQEYQQLKDRSQQYAKAEELLGKIMMVFLADLGLKVNKTDLDKVAKMAQPIPPPPPSQTPSTQVPPAPPAPAASGSHPAGGTTVSKPVADNAGQPLNWAEKEKSLGEIANENDAANFLKSVAVDNLFGSIKSSRPIDAALLDAFNGNFQGRIVMDDPQVKPQDISIELKGFREGESTSGTYKISVSTGGQATSTTSGNGELKDFKSIDGSTQAVIIRSTPSSYIQVYSVPRLNQLIGNYYKQDSIDKFSRVGTVILNRR
jgi:hypothetical protein